MATEKLILPPILAEQIDRANSSQSDRWNIERLSAGNRQDWDEFVRSSSDGLPTQLSAWEGIMSASYGYPCHFLLARRDGRVEGVLPLFLVDSFLTGRRLDSMPGAACACDSQAANALLLAADQLAHELKIDYLLLRDARHSWPDSNLEVLEAHRGIRRQLIHDIEKTWKSLPKDVRYHIRNGQKQAELEIVTDQTGVQDFYAFLNHYNRRAGTPSFSYRFLEHVTRALPDGYQITRLFHQGKWIGGFFNFRMGGSIYGMWGGSSHEFLKMKPNHQALWAMIQQGSAQGFTVLDMGRSEYPSTQYDFKEQWGDQVYPIYQLFTVYRGKKPRMLEIRNTQQKAGRFSLFRSAWKRLPDQAARRLGPHVRWHLPFG